MRRLLKKYGFLPKNLVTDDLRSYRAAARDLANGAFPSMTMRRGCSWEEGAREMSLDQTEALR